MKKLIYLLALVLLMVGCIDEPDNKTAIVNSIEQRSDGCFYVIRDNRGYHSGFLDDCGLFNVGDQVQYQKVQP